MNLVLAAVMLLAGETVILKEKATVGGRWVRVLDLLDARSDARAAFSDLYLGRAPEEGQSRIVTADEIRREMERRGLNPSSYVWQGVQVEVRNGADPSSEALRRTIADAIRRHLAEAEVSVRVVQLIPETAVEGVQVAEVKAAGSGYLVALTNGTKVEAVVRILRPREVAFAAREIAPGKVIDAVDLEIRKLETASDDPSPAPSLLIGSTAALRVRSGAALSVADLRLKPVVKKGDLVRVISSSYEVDGRALEDGAVGQEISFEFAGSRNRLRAKVVQAARVEVTEAAR